VVRIHSESLLTSLAENPIWGVRGYAINAHAGLEQALCGLLKHLTGLAPDINGLIFFKLESSRSRTAVLSGLLKKKYLSKYSAFFNSLVALVGTIDQERNEVVHWHMLLTIKQSDAGIKRDLALEPGNFWARTENTPQKDVPALVKFITKCEFASHLCGLFTMYLEGHYSDEQSAPWRGMSAVSVR
jgi:hypothetical protein